MRETLAHASTIEPFFTKVKNPQTNYPVAQLNQVIYNMLVTKDISKKLFVYIDT